MINVHLGVKTDPIEYRYSWDWLFGLMQRNGIRYIQLGSFFEIAFLEDDFFLRLREKAESYGLTFKSVFTAHREVHGWFSGDTYMKKASRKIYERLIDAGSLLGADFVGSSAGSVLRDKMDSKYEMIEQYLLQMKELMHYAQGRGIKGLSVEVMSCAAEPPTLPNEISYMAKILGDYHNANIESTSQFFIHGDTSHGYADQVYTVQDDNWKIFEKCIPYMCEFHFKNTDSLFNSTFGFSDSEMEKGIVDLKRLKTLIEVNESSFPQSDIYGYLEHPGPKLGRDYTDYRLGEMLESSLVNLKAWLGEKECPYESVQSDTMRQPAHSRIRPYYFRM